MNFFESIKSAFKSLKTHKMRSFLTMFGIIIGISSVILIASLGQGSQEAITGDLEKFGMNIMEINISREATNIKKKDLFTYNDKKIIEQHPYVEKASPLANFWGSQLINPNTKKGKSVMLTASDSDYADIASLEILIGRYFNENENIQGKKVAVIDRGTATKTFGSMENAIGKQITLNLRRVKEKFTVVGVVKGLFEDSPDFFGGDQLFVYIPIKYLERISSKKFKINKYSIKVTDPNLIKVAGADVIKMLERKHRNKDKYNIENVSESINQFNSILSKITLFVSLVAAISLFVGGIGVMNIMLVTVTERTKEIGIRKAIGAKSKDILIQFLIESIILTVLGGIIGISLGYGGALAVGKFIKITPKLSMMMLMITVLVSTSVGLIFGVYPAKKASQLNPIDALRYE